MPVKRLFWKDPSTGTETPLLIWDVNPTAVADLSVNKQDKKDNALNTDAKTVVGSINELKGMADNAMYVPDVSGTSGQVLTSDSSGGYSWQNGGVKDISLPFDPVTENLDFVIMK